MKAHLTEKEIIMLTFLRKRKAIRFVVATIDQERALNSLINKGYAMFDGPAQEWRAIK